MFFGLYLAFIFHFGGLLCGSVCFRTITRKWLNYRILWHFTEGYGMPKKRSKYIRNQEVRSSILPSSTIQKHLKSRITMRFFLYLSYVSSFKLIWDL